MLLWGFLAKLVNAIENVFRNLAGVGNNTATNDMATEIITNDMVKRIFENLVAISAALLIFFTIIKILQQQYKEKQGGNPYIIVFRMFKGMMMFFFVTAAVLVGMYASGVVFRALDTATKSGDASVAASVFRAMTNGATIMEGFEPSAENEGNPYYESAQEYYYARVSEGNNDRGGGVKYTMVTIDGSAGASGFTAAEAQDWYDSLGINNWSVVNADGSVTPLKASLSNGDFNANQGKPDFSDAIDNLKGDKYNNSDVDWENGSVDASAGYRNVALQSIECKVQPAIDVEWSPIAIQQTTFKLKEIDPLIPTNIHISVMGNSTDIPAGFQKVVYECEQPYTKVPVSENNLFSINMHGRAALQGGEASASFSLDAFVADLPVEKIMITLLVNNLLVKLLDKTIGDLPAMPLWFYIGPISFNMMTLARQVLNPFVEELLRGTLYTLTMGAVESPDEYITIGDGKTMPITWRKYDLFDEDNWEDLWKQLASSFDDLKEQLMDSYEEDGAGLEQAVRDVDKNVDEVTRQKAWGTYKGYVDDYNNQARTLLVNLSDNLDKYNADDFISLSANERETIEDEIVDDWRSLVTKYNYYKAMSGQYKPSGADAPTNRAIGQIYLPIFETGYNVTKGDQLKVADIAKEFKDGGKSSFNMVKNPTGGAGIYRIIDWSCYTTAIRNANRGVVDVYTDSVSPFMNTATLDKIGIPFAGRVNGSNQPKLVKSDLFANDNLTNDTTQTAAVTDDDGELMASDVATTPAAYNSRAEQQAAGEAIWQEWVANAKAKKAANALNPSDTDSSSTITKSGVYGGRNVTVFRRTGNTNSELSPSEGENNDQTDETVPALNTWVQKRDTLKWKNATITPVYNLKPTDVANYLCRGEAQRYLSLATAGQETEESGQRSIVGRFSYDDIVTVSALYDLGKVNYIMGYIGIVVALGVYMNFTFGLIQRAVNLAVLYMMSPITIAFYPFDDGQRFKGSFVTPFYKEAISAYSIIISLNIFIVLLTPVTEAAASVTGISLMGTIALIAFVSMLPKIRDSITGLLGAATISQKSLTDMFKDAGNTIADPFRQAVTLGKPAAKFASKVRDRQFMKAAERRKKRDEAMAKLKDKFDIEGRLSKREQKKLDRYNAMQERKKRVQDAVASRNKNGEFDARTFSALSASEQKEARKLAKKAAEKARSEGLTEAQLKKDIVNAASKEERNALIKKHNDLKARAKAEGVSVDQLMQKDRVNELLHDDDFYRSVNTSIVRKAGGGALGGLARGFEAGKEFVQNAGDLAKKVGNTLGAMPVLSLVPDALETIFHPATGMLAESKGAIGEIIRWAQPGAQMKRVQDMAEKEAAWRAVRNDVKDVKAKQLTAASEGLLQGEQSKNNTIKRMAAEMQAAEMAKSDAEVAAVKESFIKDSVQKKMAENQGKKGKNKITEKDAQRMAEREWQAIASSPDKLGAMMGGRQAAMVDDLVRGANDAKIDAKYLQAAQQKWNEAASSRNIEDLKAARKGLSAEKKATVAALVGDIAKGLNLSDDQVKGLDKVVVDAVDAGDSIDMISGKIMAHLPAGTVKEDVVKKQLDATGFTAKVNKMQFDLGSENTLINGLLEHNKKIAKAREWAYQDMNIDIDSSAFQNFFQSYRQMFDQNMQGGLIDEENKLRAKYNGDTSSAAYQRELNALQEKFSKSYDRAFNSIGNDQQIRMYDYSVREMERQAGEEVNVMAKQYQKRMRYQLDVNMSPTAKNVMITDSVLQDMKLDGDYAGVALKLNSACEAAIKKDFAALRNSGLNQQTITQLEAWANQGESGLKELRSIMDYNDLTRKFMGNADGISGGGSTQAVRNQMAAIFSVMETKEATDFLDSQLKAFASQEGSLRAQLAQYHKTVLSEFAGENWGKAVDLMNLRDQYGNKVTDLGAYVDNVVTRIEQKTLAEDSEEFNTLIDKLSTFAGDWSRYEKQIGIPTNTANGHLTKAIEALNKVKLANEYGAKQIELHGHKSKMTSGLFEISEKLEEKKK